MKIVYEVRLYDTPLLELILEEKKRQGVWSCGRYSVCGGWSEVFTAPWPAAVRCWYISL